MMMNQECGVTTSSRNCLPVGSVIAARILFLAALALLTRLTAHGDETQPHTTLFGEPLDNAATPHATILASDESNSRTRFGLPDDRYAGLQVMPTYFGDVFTNARGGRSTNDATRYLGLLDIELIADFERLKWRVPGKLYLLGQTTHGEGLTERFIGDALVHSDIDSFRNITQIGEYWWEFGVLDDDLRVRLGKQDVNTEFIYMETAADFIQSSFELSPAEVIPTYAHQSVAAVTLVRLTPSLQFKFGVWDALAPAGGWGVSRGGTTFVIGELEYKYAFGGGALPGTMVIGAARLSDGELDGDAFSAVNGLALQIEQMMLRENRDAPDDLQGLSAFAAYYPRSTSSQPLPQAIGDHFAGGVIYRGLIPDRDADVVGAGVSWAQLSRGGTNQETIFELFYKLQITPQLSFQPDLQYIVTPSGIYRDALVVGARYQAAF